jgi:hypothetical protein
MENTVVKLRCQRIGCDAMFTEDDNLDGSCQYHDLVFFIHPNSFLLQFFIILIKYKYLVFLQLVLCYAYDFDLLCYVSYVCLTHKTVTVVLVL